MIYAIFGTKITQTQGFTQDGVRIPLSRVRVDPLPVVSIKTKDKHGYTAVQVSIGKRLKEIRTETLEALPNPGDTIKAADILKPGDVVDVIGMSKGKGFAGGVKRHHFKGGPRTHGQSDRERAPGSIGQTTTPGRVYKGKRMAGRMGHEKVTVKNLRVMEVTDSEVLIKGLIPGIPQSVILITKVGESKKFSPLFKEEKPQEKILEKIQTASQEQPAESVKEKKANAN